MRELPQGGGKLENYEKDNYVLKRVHQIDRYWVGSFYQEIFVSLRFAEGDQGAGGDELGVGDDVQKLHVQHGSPRVGKSRLPIAETPFLVV